MRRHRPTHRSAGSPPPRALDQPALLAGPTDSDSRLYVGAVVMLVALVLRLLA